MKLFLSLIIGAVLGAGMTWGVLTSFPVDQSSIDPSSFAQEQYSSAVSQLDLTDCDGLEKDQVGSCIDGVLVNRARTLRDASWCDEIQGANLAASCRGTVSRLAGIDTLSTSAFCEGADIAICPEMAIVLAAHEAGDSSLCAQVKDSALQSYCFNALSFSEQEVANALSSTTCDLGNTDCENRLELLQRAVSSQDPSLCNELSDDLSLIACTTEVLIYQAYLTGDEAICSPLTTGAQQDCLLAIAVGQSLSSGENTCNSLENLSGICNDIVAQGVYSRFNFVQ